MRRRLAACLVAAAAATTAPVGAVGVALGASDDYVPPLAPQQVHEDAFFAAAHARDDAPARWRAEASAANIRALGVAPGRIALLFAARDLSAEVRALAVLGYRVEAYDVRGETAADVELRLLHRFLP